MNETYKEKLSRHVEGIFKGYASPGLHICDIATGGGKSYTIGKLTCEYYPNSFDRIVILCVQNKLVNGMKREIDRFIDGPSSIIKPSDKMVIENNQEVITKAIKSGSFHKLIEEMQYQIGEQKKQDIRVTEIQNKYNYIKKVYEGLSCLIKTLDENSKNNDYVQNQLLSDSEANLRKAVRIFFDTFKKHLEKTKQLKKVSLEAIQSRFPSLVEVYPQVDY